MKLSRPCRKYVEGDEPHSKIVPSDNLKKANFPPKTSPFRGLMTYDVASQMGSNTRVSVTCVLTWNKPNGYSKFSSRFTYRK